MASIRTRRLIYISLMAVMAYCLRIFSFSLFPAAPYLKMDPGEIPIMFMFMVSTGSGLMSLLLKEIITLVISGSNVLGLIADFMIAGTFFVCFSYLYTRFVEGRHTFVRVLVVTVIASMVRVVVAVPVNLLILKLQFGMSAAAVWAAMPFIAPFNLIKSLFGGFVFYVLYQRVREPLMSLQIPLAPSQSHE
ncbi:MAG: ECF transporter S component [Saccharofermentanales bacterium]|jgi:riboflavin transporter FmnP